jgi:putative membrane protein
MSVSAQMCELDHDRISLAVHEAEGGTSGEIVTIIANSSDRYDDVALWWSIAVAIFALGWVTIFSDFYIGLVDYVLGDWAIDWTPRRTLELGLTIVIAKFVGMWLLMLWRPLRLFLTPGAILTKRVHRRAIACFKVGAERRTVGRTGILIYLSLAEHRAEIVADEAIHAKVANGVWGDAMADMVGHVREGRIADGMIAAVRDVGAILSTHFPRAEDDRNELPDRLIEL